MGGSNTIVEEKTKTSSKTGQCLRLLSLGSSYGTRTRVSTLKGWHPGPLDEGAKQRGEEYNFSAWKSRYIWIELLSLVISDFISNNYLG